MKKPLILFSLAITIFSSQLLFAQTAEERGLEIAKKQVVRDQGWIDLQADLEMILFNRHGEQSNRSNSIKTMEVKDDGDKSLIVFHTPKDLKGTAMLTYSHAVVPDEQWLYLPALKRTKRISSSNKSGPFLGSEFAYEDLSSFEIEKFSYKYIKEESIKGRPCYVVEYTPLYSNSGYTRQLAWVDKELYHPLRIDFYDRKNEILKTLTFDGYKKYLDKIWRPTTMDVVNHQTGKRTLLTWNNIRLNTGLKDSEFSTAKLKTAR
ncbi:MAG: outer membrane lipoprotein-sorting protein [Gammaproteobacteria bacterium]|nr:outer membrane lipoprotein-sorting protein [Gammaproteobacteria bacterium]